MSHENQRKMDFLFSAFCDSSNRARGEKTKILIDEGRKMNKRMPVLCMLLLFFLFTAVFGGSSAPAEEKIENLPGGQLSVSADVGGRINPPGLAVFGGFKYRHVYRYDTNHQAAASYLQTGAGIGLSPAGIQAGAHIEVLPWIFLPIRIQYDYYQYFGTRGGLLSFSSPDADYGDHVRNERSDEESAHGHRILLQPVIQGKTGRFIARNQTDLAYYRFSGKGPYFLELSYDTLLKDSDYLVSNRTCLLYSFFEGRPYKALLAGPYYELTHAFGAQITQQKIGIAAYWEGIEKKGPGSGPYIGLMAGYHLQDPNRQNQFYLMISTGFRFSSGR